MRPLQWIGVIALILFLNNLVVLHMLGYFDDANDNPSSKIDTTPSLEVVDQDLSSALDVALNDSTDRETSKPEALSQENDGFAEAFKSFSETSEFSEILEKWQHGLSSKWEALDKNLSAMSTQELIDGYFSLSSRTDRQNYYSKIRENGLSRVSLADLKRFFADDVIGDWQKADVLAEMVKRDDAEALQWAKNIFISGESARAFGHALSETLYEKDPGFMLELMQNLSLEEYRKKRYQFSGVLHKSDIAKAFIQHNLSELLQPDVRVDGLYVSSSIDVELSDAQTYELVDLFDAGDLHKRQLAISLARNIEDLDLLRDAYSQLGRADEQWHYLNTLYTQYKTPEQRDLVRELARASSNPRIRRIIAADLEE